MMILMCSLVVELGAAPVAALGVPLDGVAGLEAHPVGSGAVLLKLLSVLKLDGERAEATHGLGLSSLRGRIVRGVHVLKHSRKKVLPQGNIKAQSEEEESAVF